MKITPAQYAKSLYETVKDKDQSEINVLIGNFVGILKKNNHLRLKNKIVEKFQELFNLENGIVSVKVISRAGLDEKTRLNLQENLKKRYLAKEIVLEEEINPQIKGGIILKVKDEILDASIKKQLINFKKQLAY